jgi:peptidylprolyl isomerase
VGQGFESPLRLLSLASAAMFRRLPLAALLAALVLAGCGGGNDDKTTDTTSSDQASQPAETQTETTQDNSASSGSTKVVVSKSTNLKKKPTIPRQTGDAPTQLVKSDVVRGKGATAKAGDTVTVQYVGVRFRDGKQFDASWDRGQPFTFPLGAGQVIPGWDQGVAGMKVGGRRQLTIPSDLAYGAQGAPPDIAPNETLIFVVDLKKVQKG